MNGKEYLEEKITYRISDLDSMGIYIRLSSIKKCRGNNNKIYRTVLRLYMGVIRGLIVWIRNQN